MKPISIKQTAENVLTFTWDDGLVTPLTFQQLRDECPCASCKGETVLLKSILPVMQPKLPGHYELKSVAPIGSYAVQISWGDGHNTGLYTWEYVRMLSSQANE